MDEADARLVRCEITEWISDEPIPGLVKAQMRDAEGRNWVFRDKVGIFTERAVRPDTPLPMDGGMRCVVLATRERAGRKLATVRLVDTDADGAREFVVDAETLFDEAP